MADTVNAGAIATKWKKNDQQVRFLVWVLKTNEMLYYSVFCSRELLIFPSLVNLTLLLIIIAEM